MKLKTAKLLADATEGADHEVTVMEGYSGRGMYGEAEAAVTADNVKDVIVAVFLAATDLDPGDDRISEMLDDLMNLRTDNMGRGIVVY